MVHEMIDGTYRQTNLTNESAEYLTAREELRHAEIELMRQRERVAELRRGLPKGATVQDYEFLEGPASLDAGDLQSKNVTAQLFLENANQVSTRLAENTLTVADNLGRVIVIDLRRNCSIRNFRL